MQAMQKATYRKHLLAARARLSPAYKQAATHTVVERLQAEPAFQAARTIGIYWPLAHEPDLRPVITQDKHWALPSNASGVYQFHAFNTHLIRQSDGCFSPKNSASIKTLDLMIVPCVGVDTDNYRLGRGGGVYDRLLQAYPCVSIGLAYACQQVPRLPREPHDQPLKIVYLL